MDDETVDEADGTSIADEVDSDSEAIARKTKDSGYIEQDNL